MEKSKYKVRRTVEVSVLGKITASAGTLDSISLLLMELAAKARKEGNDKMADLRDKQSGQIYNALEKTGFYKD